MSATRLPPSALLVGLLGLALAACTVRSARVDVPDVPVPAAFENATPHEGNAAERPLDAPPWWTHFGDPSLDRAVEAALAGNLSLDAAWARVEQANASTRSARAGRRPTLSAGADASRSRSPSFGPASPEATNQVQLSTTASYEVDLWRRNRSTHFAALHDRDALADDARSVAMSLSANVAESWLTICFQRARRTLIQDQLRTQEQLLSIVEHRLVTGGASALDIEQQRQQLEALRAEMELIDAQEQSAAIALRALQGQTPSAAPLDAPDALPSLPPMPAIGVPADLLTQRPDVRAAFRRAEAADARVTAAVAARLPTLRLSATAFLQSDGLSGLFDDLFWNLAAGLTAPLFQGGRLNAEVDRNEAVLDERLIAWADTLLTSLREVEEALVLEEQQRRYLEQVDQQLATATRSLDLAAEQYRRGVADYLRVLTAITTLQQLEQAKLAGERQLLSYRIQLYRALGGAWLDELGPDADAEGDQT